MNKSSEKETLDQLLNNCRDTPHPATGLPLAAMLSPRKLVTDIDVSLASEKDKRMKQEKT